MSPSPASPLTRDEELNAGLIAFNEVKAFQRPSAACRQREGIRDLWSPLLLITGSVIPFLCGDLSKWAWVRAGVFLLYVQILLVVGFRARAREKKQYLKNLETLRLLKAKYGSDVPWLKVMHQQTAHPKMARANADDLTTPAQTP